jgi:hypothetical protein
MSDLEHSKLLEKFKEPSDSGGEPYIVAHWSDGRWTCGCWDYRSRQHDCKHILRRKDKIDRGIRPKPVDVQEVMKSLKDFQKSTVNYVYRRLYQDADPARRFLIADEVGLGKTLIARGLLARVLERRRRAGKRLRVLYICSNSEIARQNILRINPGQAGETVDSASRLTLLAEHSGFRTRREVDFFAFTPDTSFDPGSSRGRKEERVLLYYLLKRFWHLKGKAALEILRAAAGFEGFEPRGPGL